MESEFIEYKRNFGKEVIISLVAFANSDGGTVVVGIENYGTPCGLEIGQETLQRYLNEIKVATYPQLLPKAHVAEQDGNQLLVFEVSEFPIKPVSYKNRYFKRVHNSNHLMTLEEIVDLQQQSMSISYDTYPVNVSLATLSLPLIEKFLARVNNRGRFNLNDDLLTNLSKLRLIREGRPAFAANLLFGEHGYAVHIGRFKSESTIVDDILVKSPVFNAIDEIIVFIKKHINLSYTFDGGRERKERWQYPLEAIRELVLNAIVHRDYKSASDIVIKIFDDRMVISNPGRIYGNLRIEDLQRNDYVSSLRNKLLAEAFYLSGDIEKYGTGFIRIREFLIAYPETTLAINETGDFFMATLSSSPPISPPIAPVGLITPLEERVLRLILLSPTASSGEMAAHLGISRDTVKEYLGRLKEKGCLVREGSPKTGRWRVTDAGRAALEKRMALNREG